MKRYYLILLVLAVIMSIALFSLSESQKKFTRLSYNPQYALVALNRDGTRALRLCFYRSSRQARGYDTLRADLDFNGDFSDEKDVGGSLLWAEGAQWLRRSFEPLEPNVPYNSAAEGIEEPWQLTLSYMESREPGREYQIYLMETKMRLANKAGIWEYATHAQLHTTEKPAPLMAAVFEGEPYMRIDAQPDKAKPGHTGIAVYLSAGSTYFRCTKAREPLKAHVSIKNESGERVLSEDVELEKLAFG